MSWNEEARISCRFRFKCLQTWDRLQATDVEGVLHWISGAVCAARWWEWKQK